MQCGSLKKWLYEIDWGFLSMFSLLFFVPGLPLAMTVLDSEFGTAPCFRLSQVCR